MINVSLYEGELVQLASFDADQDAETIAKWTHDADFMRLVDDKPARPLSAAQVKKLHEEMQKDVEKGRGPYWFTIRAREDDRLIGFASLQWIEWSNGTSWLRFGIASPEDQGKGYGRDALRLVLRYAFGELNLNHLGIQTPAYNERGLRFLEAAGFTLEVRRRELVYRDGRRWDELDFGLLRREWEERMRRTQETQP